MEEICKDIEGYYGLYQISNKGNVKSLERKVKGKNGSYYTVKEKILKQLESYIGNTLISFFLKKNISKKILFIINIFAFRFFI